MTHFTTHLTNISKTLDYVDSLLDLLFNEVTLNPAPYLGKLCEMSIPGPLSVQCERSDKEVAVAGFVSRFNLGGYEACLIEAGYMSAPLLPLPTHQYL